MGRDGAAVTAGTVCTMATMTFDIAGKPVGRIGYGAMQLSGPGVMGPPRDHDEATAVLRRAVEAGVNHIDTAQYYGPNVANELIREALHPYPDDLVIVSKVGTARDEAGGWHAAQTPADLRAGVEDNLRTLGVEQLGAVNLRRLEHDMSDEPRVPLADQLAEMVALREEGKIAGVGISTPPSLTSTRRSGLRRSGRRPCRCHVGAGRSGLAARPCRQHPAHPGHVVTRPPRGEPRRARPRLVCGRSGRARQLLKLQISGCH